MKQNISALLIAGSLWTVAATHGATVAYWNFEDGVDGQLFDADGGWNNGSYDIVDRVLMRGADSYWSPNFSSDNLFYNGLCMRNADRHRDGFVTDGALIFWAPTNWTIECTVRLDEIDGRNTLIGRDGSSFGEKPSDFYLQYSGGDRCFSLKYRTAGGQFIIIDATNVVVHPGQWYGLAAVSDGQKTSLYIDERDGNGYELEGSAAMASTNVAENALAGSRFAWTFGRGWFDGNYVDRINGAMDNIRFSDSALSPSEFIRMPEDPFVMTYAPTGPIADASQTIEASILDEDSEFSSAVLLLDGTPVATNNTPSGTTNHMSYTATDLPGGTHFAEMIVAGINPSVTLTQSWTFVIKQPPVPALIDGATPGQWTMDLDAAKEVADERKFPILLDFSGSDWCGWCKLMETNVFMKSEWEDYATNHLLMVLIDFPRDKSLVPEKYVDRNRSLQEQYNVRGFPTYVILDNDGKTELGRLRAGQGKTPSSFIAELAELFDLRPAEIEAYTATLSLEDKEAYLALIDQLKATIGAKKQTQADMTGLQIKFMQLGQDEERQKGDLHYFRIARLIEDPVEREIFESLVSRLQEAKKNRTEWMASKPDDTDENMNLYKAMNQQIEELEEQISQYEEH